MQTDSHWFKPHHVEICRNGFRLDRLNLLRERESVCVCVNHWWSSSIGGSGQWQAAFRIEEGLGFDHGHLEFFFFQNNTKIQTIWLFSKLTSWVQETRFWCAKLSITDSSSIKLEGRNPNHTKKENKPEGRNLDQTKKKHEEGKQTGEIKRRRNKHEETQIKRRRNKHEETQTKWKRKKPTNPNLLKANRSAQTEPRQWQRRF